MFKKALSIFAVLFLAIGILFVSLDRVTNCTPTSFAASSLKFYVSSPPATASSEATPSASESKINYYLPYPGILPDHPFYKLKMVRDRIWLFLTTNSLKRAELLLLFADKRIGAGEVLIKGNKTALGVSTLLKGEKYLEKAINETQKAKKQGLKVEMITVKIKNASFKYEEILTELIELPNSQDKTGLENVKQLIKNLQERAASL